MHTLSRREVEALIESREFVEWWTAVREGHAREGEIAGSLDELRERRIVLLAAATARENQARGLLKDAAGLEEELEVLLDERDRARERCEKTIGALEAIRDKARSLWDARAKAAIGAERQAVDTDYRLAIEEQDSAWTLAESLKETVDRLTLRLSELKLGVNREKTLAAKILAQAKAARETADGCLNEAKVLDRTLEVARAAHRKLLHDSASRFGALVLSEYLYFGHSADPWQVFCVAATTESPDPVLFVIDRTEGIERIAHALSDPTPLVASSRHASRS